MAVLGPPVVEASIAEVLQRLQPASDVLFDEIEDVESPLDDAHVKQVFSCKRTFAIRIVDEPGPAEEDVS
jgi:hypothetical protein